MTELWPCRCGCYRAGAQEIAEATYADNLEPAARRTYRASPFEGVTVVRWAEEANEHATEALTMADLALAAQRESQAADEPHIIRGTE